MIRVLPTICLVLAVLMAVSLLGWLAAAILRKGRIVGVLRLTCLLAALSLLAAAAGLARYSAWLSTQIASLPFGASRADVLQVLGEPTEKIDPAIGVGLQPDPNCAIWYYQIKLWPFRAEHYMEFAYGKLLAK